MKNKQKEWHPATKPLKKKKKNSHLSKSAPWQGTKSAKLLYNKHGKSQIIGRIESLALYKSFNTLCYTQGVTHNSVIQIQSTTMRASYPSRQFSQPVSICKIHYNAVRLQYLYSS